jgi:hypothetical protein
MKANPNDGVNVPDSMVTCFGPKFSTAEDELYMASSPPELVFKMIRSPWAAMLTACASVAQGVIVGLGVQAVSKQKKKKKKKKNPQKKT